MSFPRALLKKFFTVNTFLVLGIICLCVVLIHRSNVNLKTFYTSEYIPLDPDNIISSDPGNHDDIVNSYFQSRKDWRTSNLGSLMFKNVSRDFEIYQKRKTQTFVILIWKYWDWLKVRHVDNFNSKRKNDPLSECSVHNCNFTGEDSAINTADAVIIHIQKGIFPSLEKRNPKQRWVFLSDESPINSFSMAKSAPKLSDLANIFNWSMTYRTDSDVPVPYGRTIPLQKPILNQITYEYMIALVPYWKHKHRDVLATILISNCAAPRRMNYLNELQEHLSVDVYGKCSKDHKTSCPGHFKSDCDLISNYLFYLVFENSLCEDYLTEKVFYHAFDKGAIPVIMGSTTDNCEQLLPPNSFLHVDDYENPKELAKHIIEISKDDQKLLSYHRWRNDFEVVNEHGYFGSKSYHFCRICEALNYNDDEEKVYDENALKIYFDPELSCR